MNLQQLVNKYGLRRNEVGEDRAISELRSALGIAKKMPPTTCDKGHPYDETNTYIRSDGGRRCKLCERERKREYRRNTRNVSIDL